MHAIIRLTWLVCNRYLFVSFRGRVFLIIIFHFAFFARLERLRQLAPAKEEAENDDDDDDNDDDNDSDDDDDDNSESSDAKKKKNKAKADSEKESEAVVSNDPACMMCLILFCSNNNNLFH